MNGHGSCKPTSITKEYNQKWGTLCEPTATGFEFKGWKNGTTTVTADSKATDDITVTAQWETKDNIFIYTVSEANQCKNKNDCSNVLKCTEGCTLKIDSRTKITITAPITTNWNVEFYQSGTLESTNTVSVDLHAVGGGGSGASGGGGTSEASHWRAGGGGGGYVNYAKGKTLTKQKYTVTVGAGGIAPGYHQDGNQGGTSSFGSLVSAAGGYGGTTCDGSKDFCHQAVPTSGNGGSGGSGGGASGLSWDDNGSFKTGGNGGSNGSDGTTNTNHLAGKGQNSSTRDFGEASGTLRAGGGGGRGGYQSAGGVYLTANGTGGSGGGGNGAKSNSTGTDSNSCTPPTPGDNKFGGGGGAGGGNYSGCQNGAAGGSGIVIMRNKR